MNIDLHQDVTKSSSSSYVELPVKYSSFMDFQIKNDNLKAFSFPTAHLHPTNVDPLRKDKYELYFETVITICICLENRSVAKEFPKLEM